MHVVFLGMPEAEGQVGPSVELPAGARGGPVFDIAGRLVGLALPDEAGAHARLLPVSMLIATFGARLGPQVAASATRMPANALYERALGVALQVIVDAP